MNMQKLYLQWVNEKGLHWRKSRQAQCMHTCTCTFGTTHHQCSLLNHSNHSNKTVSLVAGLAVWHGVHETVDTQKMDRDLTGSWLGDGYSPSPSGFIVSWCCCPCIGHMHVGQSVDCKTFASRFALKSPNFAFHCLDMNKLYNYLWLSLPTCLSTQWDFIHYSVHVIYSMNNTVTSLPHALQHQWLINCE